MMSILTVFIIIIIFKIQVSLLVQQLEVNVGGTSYVWRGDIAEVIIFDRVLTYEEIVDLETYLKKKWGIVEGCSLPTSTAGYNVTGCNTTADPEGLLTESECSVSCAAGYRADTFEEVTATCVSRQ